MCIKYDIIYIYIISLKADLLIIKGENNMKHHG